MKDKRAFGKLINSAHLTLPIHACTLSTKAQQMYAIPANQ
jgi:hypothetical protein